jgi:hypothetical protein
LQLGISVAKEGLLHIEYSVYLKGGVLGERGLLHIQYLYENLFFVKIISFYTLFYINVSLYLNNKCVLIKSLTDKFHESRFRNSYYF